MAIYAISDIHVKPDLTNSKILKKFLNIDFKSEDKIFFLGDIFDLMVGDHKEFELLYPFFFEFLNKAKLSKIEVHYFEGNHDFHIESLFEGYGVVLHKSPIIYNFLDSKYLFCHGDEIQIDNPSYERYRRFVKSKILNFIANKILPYSLLKYIGESASKKSRSRNKNRYGESQLNFEIRDSFRKAAKQAQQKYDVSVVVCGHSHFYDDYSWNGSRYINCGYLPNSKRYIKIDKEISFQSLS